MHDVLVLNQYYDPDVAVTGRHAATIARRLAGEGMRVRALVGQPSYVAGTPREARSGREHGVDVRRVWMPRGGREALRRRVAGYAAYLTEAALHGARERARVVVSFHNPPLLGLVAVGLARRIGAGLVYIPQDIHPDVVDATGMVRLPAAVSRAWDAAGRLTVTRADRVVALGSGVRETLIAKGAAPDRVRVIPLWAEPELDHLAPAPDWKRAQGLPDRPLVVYAGNLGAMHPFASVLDAIGRLPAGALELVVAGGGIGRARWEAAAAQRGIGIRFLPYQSDAAYRSMLAASAATLVTLAPGMERLAVPSKAWSSFAAGRPVIAHMAQAADVAALVQRTGAGWWAPDADALEAVFRRVADDATAVEAAGEAARRLYEREFSREVVTGRYVALVRELLEQA